MSVKNSQKALPKTLFIYAEKDSENEFFYFTTENYKDTASFDEVRTVGVYKLEKTVKVSAVAKVEQL